jgi:zinc protease
MRMPKFLLAATLAFAGTVTHAQQADPPAGGDRLFDQPYLMRTLENGLRVIVVRTDTPGVVSLQIPVQTGSRNEIEKGKSGFAHFFEHMMFRGTEKYPPDAYQAIITRAGGDQNAYTTADYTNYHINFTTDDLEKMLEIEADRFQNLKYTEAQFRTEALAVKGEYLKNYSSPIMKAFERISDMAFSTHTYGHTTMGYLEDIEDMPNQMEYSKTFFDRWYRPEYSAVIVVGDVQPEATMALVERYWGDWQRGSYTQTIPVEPPLDGPKYEHLHWQGPTLPYVAHAWRAPAFTTRAPDTAALMLMNELDFGASSELYQQVVVRERWADQLFAMPPTSKDPGLFLVVARLTDAAHAGKVNAAISQTLARLRGTPIQQERLDATRSRLKYEFAGSLASADSLASTLASFVHYERTPETLNALYRQVDALTPEDLVAVADKVFADSNRVSLSIGTEASLAGAETFASVDEAVAAARSRPLPDVDVVALPSTSPLVEVSLIFDAGAVYDPPGKAGLAALTAAMLTDAGSARRSHAEIQQAFYPIASGFNAQVDKHMLRLSGTVHRDNLDTWYGLVREMLLEPGFREDDFERLKQQQVNGIRVSLRGNNDEELGKEALYEMVYGHEHPYGRLTLGHAGDVEAITLDDVRGFYRERIVRAGMRVGLSGNYGEDFQRRLLSDLALLPEGRSAAPDVAPAPLGEGRRARILQKESTSVAVSFGWPIPVNRSHEDWLALWVVRSWLGEHRNSAARLYQRIREERGMNYGDYAYIEYFPAGMYRFQPEPNHVRHNDLFQVWLRPLRSNNDALFATRAALYEIGQLVENGLSEEGFENTRAFLRKYAAILTAAPHDRLGYALDADWFGTPTFIEHVRDGLDRLTLDEVNAAIRRHFHPDAAQFVFVAKDGQELAQMLAADQRSPIEYNSEKPAELLAEDRLIEALPLKLSADRIEVVPADRVFE